MVCDSVVLASGCLDHLLDGWSRKTTAARGRTVDGEAPPGHAEPPPPCDPIACLDSCVRLVWVDVNTSVHAFYGGFGRTLLDYFWWRIGGFVSSLQLFDLSAYIPLCAFAESCTTDDLWPEGRQKEPGVSEGMWQLISADVWQSSGGEF